MYIYVYTYNDKKICLGMTLYVYIYIYIYILDFHQSIKQSFSPPARFLIPPPSFTVTLFETKMKLMHFVIK